MDADEEVLSGRRARRRWLMVVGSLPFLAALGAAIWFFVDQRQEAQNTVMVERVTGAAFGCVASIRGDAPDVWGLSLALEHMSRMARVTLDRDDPTTAAERERFARLAADAARGCEELGNLMREAHDDALYFAVPAPLAQLVDSDNPERWFRRVLPETRPQADELRRQIRTMALTVNERRAEYQLMAQELPIEGRGASELARVVELAPPPRDRENPGTEAWPTPTAIVVLRRGSIARVPCDTRFVNRASCFNEYLQLVTWEGEAGEPRALERPDGVLYWSAFTPTFDGAFWAVGIDSRSHGVVGRYAADATVPELGAIGATIDADAKIVAVTGGVAVFPSDGSSWMTGLDGPIELRVVESTPPPLIVRAGRGGAGHGIEIDEQGTLSVFGTEVDGFTSRLEVPEAEEDVLLRVVDAHQRVRDVVDLRALRSGRAVALLQRFNESPDAIAITSTFGRSWLAATPEQPAPAE